MQDRSRSSVSWFVVRGQAGRSLKPTSVTICRSDAELGLNRFPERFLNGLKGHPVIDIGKEAFNDQAYGRFARHAAGLEIEDHFFINLSRRGAVRAAHVIGLDFQTGN